MKMAGYWCCHLADQFVLLSFRHIGAYHYIHWRWPSLCQLDLERTASVGELLTDSAQGWAVRKLTRRWGYLDDLAGLRLRGATDDCPPPLLPPTRRGLYGWRPGHIDRPGKGMCPQLGENCAKDTTEEEITSTHKPVLARAPSNSTKHTTNYRFQCSHVSNVNLF